MWCRRFCSLPKNHFTVQKVYDNIFKEFHTSSAWNAGHSKWANIRHIKALKDGQKSAIFTKYARQIRLAIQEGGSSDPALNTVLRSVIEDALRKNMPMATIQNSIKKSDQNKAVLKKHFLYWRFQQKVFAVCSVCTDNFPQLKMDLAAVLRKSGTVYVEGQHMFDDVGIIEAVAGDEIKSKAKSLDELEQISTEDAIDCGVEEVEVVDHTKGTLNFLCNPIELQAVSRALKAKGYLIENSEHIFIPKNTVDLTENELKAYEKFVQKVREFPAVEEIYDNITVSAD